jgi:hypothetical protein
VVPAASITPKLEPKSHDKFFDHDYPDDHRAVEPPHAWQHPYPIVQDSEDYDLDFVKDENSDGGEWKVQQDYDNLRGKLAAEKKLLAAAKLRDELSKDTDYVEVDVHNFEDCQKELAKARAKLAGLTDAQAKAQAALKAATDDKASADDDKAAKEKEKDDLQKQIDAQMEVHEAALKDYEEAKAKFLALGADLKVSETRLRSIYHRDVDPDGGVYYHTIAPKPVPAPAPAPPPVAPPKPTPSGATALLASPLVLALVTTAVSSLWW